MVKLRHRIKWSLPTETWAKVETAANGALFVLCMMIATGIVAVWIDLWDDLHGRAQEFAWTALGALFLVVAIVTWILVIAYINVILIPKKPEAPRRPGFGSGGRV